MGKKLYKYSGSDVMSKAFSKEGFCSFKCSYPKDFNDPYELFLTIDYNQSPEVLSYYRETTGRIPQKPTTCFSKSPDVIPMWAHYAHNHTGVVVEVDEELLSEYFPEIGFGDIDYLDEPSNGIMEQLNRAHATCKPRHVFFLQSAVFSAAYYTKTSCWSYERERRLVAGDEDCENLNGLLLIHVPIECVTALIVGHKTDLKTKENMKSLSEKLGCLYYEIHVGRSTPTPYFSDSDKSIYSFNGSSIVNVAGSCGSCNEPVPSGRKTCSWCSINDDHKISAAGRNPMRMMDEIGILDQYYKDITAIGRGSKK